MKKMVERPVSFEIKGHLITVRYFETVRDPETGAEIFGLCNPMINEVWLATHLRGTPLSEDVIWHSFYHEWEHFKLIILNEGELNINEKFVDTSGGLNHQLHKSLKTKKCRR